MMDNSNDIRCDKCSKIYDKSTMVLIVNLKTDSQSVVCQACKPKESSLSSLLDIPTDIPDDFLKAMEWAANNGQEED